MLGRIDTGRPNLGFTMHVAVHRLMQFTLRMCSSGSMGFVNGNAFLKGMGFGTGFLT